VQDEFACLAAGVEPGEKVLLSDPSLLILGMQVTPQLESLP
jgi:hypothetical protein